mmetsp:Transcript_91904/g.259603  ORF Transcript_91904/g.259603 Transcript_91904/m.259603 type:complete len:278 (-) Transcript_91904:316-1149(-)
MTQSASSTRSTLSPGTCTPQCPRSVEHMGKSMRDARVATAAAPLRRLTSEMKWPLRAASTSKVIGKPTKNVAPTATPTSWVPMRNSFSRMSAVAASSADTKNARSMPYMMPPNQTVWRSASERLSTLTAVGVRDPSAGSASSRALFSDVNGVMSFGMTIHAYTPNEIHSAANTWAGKEARDRTSCAPKAKFKPEDTRGPKPIANVRMHTFMTSRFTMLARGTTFQTMTLRMMSVPALTPTRSREPMTSVYCSVGGRGRDRRGSAAIAKKNDAMAWRK